MRQPSPVTSSSPSNARTSSSPLCAWSVERSRAPDASCPAPHATHFSASPSFMYSHPQNQRTLPLPPGAPALAGGSSRSDLVVDSASALLVLGGGGGTTVDGATPPCAAPSTTASSDGEAAPPCVAPPVVGGNGPPVTASSTSGAAPPCATPAPPSPLTPRTGGSCARIPTRVKGLVVGCAVVSSDFAFSLLLSLSLLITSSVAFLPSAASPVGRGPPVVFPVRRACRPRPVLSWHRPPPPPPLRPRRDA